MRKYIFLTIFTLTHLLALADINSTKEYQLVLNVTKSLNKKDIAKTIGVKSSDLVDFFDNKMIITEEFAKNIEPTLKGYLESHGYFDATYNINKRNNIIDISINEGEPVLVKSVKVESNFDIKKIVSWKEGDIFSSNRFVKIKGEIETKLLENGYCNANLDTKSYVDLKQHSAKLVYKLDKGKVCYFGDIKIVKKPSDIKKDVILSRLAYKRGDVFDIRKIKNSYSGLNSLGTFANLQIKYELNKNTYVDTSVSIDKKDKLRRYTVALGVDSEIGLRAKGLWEKHNFLSNAKKLSYELSFSKNRQELQATLFAPAFYSFNDYYLDFYLKGGFLRDKEDAYKEKSAFINGYLEYNNNSIQAQAGIELKRLNIKLFGNYPSKIGGVFNILSPYATLVYDKRDSKIDPKNGYYLKAYGEFGLNYRTNGVKYFKYQFEGRAIKSFDDLTLSAVGKFGAIHESNGRLPASKLFYGGGLFSNRAYGKDKIGSIISSRSFSALGGKSFINLQLEANYKIHKKFYGAVFVDSTMISKKEYSFHGKRIDTAGFGLRYKTPIGPIKIDVGFNIHKRKDYAISIMLGQSF